MSKSLLYAANTLTQNISVTTGTVVNFGSIVRRYGPNLKMSGGNVVAQGSGYYTVAVNINFVDTVEGTITVQLYKNGIAIPGAISVKTVTAGDYDQFIIPAAFKTECCGEATITAQISGGTGTINSASILIEKE